MGPKLHKFITGDANVQAARAAEEVLGALPKRTRAQRSALVKAERITRRHLFKRTLEVGGGVMGMALAGKLVVDLLDDSEVVDSQKASLIRQQMRDFESANENNVTLQTITHLFELTKNLYGPTFGHRPYPTTLVLEQGQVYSSHGGIIRVGTVENRHVFLTLGSSDSPGINKLSVIRALIESGFIQTQTQIKRIGKE